MLVVPSTLRYKHIYTYTHVYTYIQLYLTLALTSIYIYTYKDARCAKYYAQGARFAKWRAVLHIKDTIGATPSQVYICIYECIYEGIHTYISMLISM
jgi:hypothetical protein